MFGKSKLARGSSRRKPAGFVALRGVHRGAGSGRPLLVRSAAQAKRSFPDGHGPATGPAARRLPLLLGLAISIATPAAATREDDLRSRADAALDAWRMDEVIAALPLLPDDVETDYIRGIAANRSNHVKRSERLLSHALIGLERTRPDRAARALLVLADDYRKSSSYAAQARALERLITRHADRLAPEVLAGARTDLALSSALKDAPPQTIRSSGPVTLPIRRNPVGTLDVDVIAEGVTGPWMLDSGANYSIVSESFAKRLKLEAAGSITGVGSITGIDVDSRVAIVKELRLGSITVRNVAVLVVRDELLHVKLPTTEYQIDAALGFPVFQALGKVTIRGDATITAAPRSAPLVDGATMYMNELTPVLALTTQGRSLPFTLDTGANSTDLWHAYWETVGDDASSWPHRTRRSSGLGGAKTFDIVLQPELRLLVGNDVVILKDVPIEAGDQHGAGDQPMFGNIGQDLWRNAAGFTMDLRSMRFRLEH